MSSHLILPADALGEVVGTSEHRLLLGGGKSVQIFPKDEIPVGQGWVLDAQGNATWKGKIERMPPADKIALNPSDVRQLHEFARSRGHKISAGQH